MPLWVGMTDAQVTGVAEAIATDPSVGGGRAPTAAIRRKDTVEGPWPYPLRDTYGEHAEKQRPAKRGERWTSPRSAST